MGSNSQYYNYYYNYHQWYNYYKRLSSSRYVQQSYPNFGFPNAPPLPPSTIPPPPPPAVPLKPHLDIPTGKGEDLNLSENSNIFQFKPSTVTHFTSSKETFSNLHEVTSSLTNDPKTAHLAKYNFAPAPEDPGLKMRDNNNSDTGSPAHSTPVYYWYRRTLVISHQGRRGSSTSGLLMSGDTESVTPALDKTSKGPYTSDMDSFTNDRNYISLYPGISPEPKDQIPWFCLPPPSPPPEEPPAPSTLGGEDLPESMSPNPVDNDAQLALAVSKPKIFDMSCNQASSLFFHSSCQESSQQTVSKKNPQTKKKKKKMYLKAFVDTIDKCDRLKFSSFNAPSEERVKVAAFEKSISHLPQVLREMFGPLKCNLCGVVFSSVLTGLTHYEGKLHRKKVDKCLINHSEYNILADVTFPIKCNICGVLLTSAYQCLEHYSGKVHKKNTWTKEVLEMKARNRAYPEEWEGAKLVVKDYEEAIKEYNDHCSNMECDNYCKLCDLFTSSAEALVKHCQEPKHVKRLQKESCLANGEEEEKEYLHQFKKPTGEFYCNVCDYSADNVSMFESHLESVLHQCMDRK